MTSLLHSGELYDKTNELQKWFNILMKFPYIYKINNYIYISLCI